MKAIIILSLLLLVIMAAKTQAVDHEDQYLSADRDKILHVHEHNGHHIGPALLHKQYLATMKADMDDTRFIRTTKLADLKLLDGRKVNYQVSEMAILDDLKYADDSDTTQAVLLFVPSFMEYCDTPNCAQSNLIYYQQVMILDFFVVLVIFSLYFSIKHVVLTKMKFNKLNK